MQEPQKTPDAAVSLMSDLARASGTAVEPVTASQDDGTRNCESPISDDAELVVHDRTADCQQRHSRDSRENDARTAMAAIAKRQGSGAQWQSNNQ